MSKLLKKILFSLILMVVFTTSANALTISEDSVTIPSGGSENIILSINTLEKLTSIEFTLVFDSYDIPVVFVVDAKYRDNNSDGPKHKIIFDTPITGNVKLGVIKVSVIDNPKVIQSSAHINNAKGRKEDGTTILLSNQDISVSVLKEGVGEDTFLKEIKSSLVDISLKDKVYEYAVDITSDIKELDLDPIAISQDYKVDISSQKISELEDGIITIKVSNKVGDTKTYKIKVNIKEDDKKVVKEEKQIQQNNSYKWKWITPTIFFSIILVFGCIILKKEK